MNVAVVGSYRSEQPLLRNEAEFDEACRLIGQSLAEWGHRLVVPHADAPNTAESQALKAFKEIAPSRYYPCIVRQGDPVLKAHLDAVEMSDAVILIGGQNGTYASGLGALRRRKLILPIPVFGGSAKDLCEIPEIDQMVSDEIRNLNLDDADWIGALSAALSSALNAFPRVLIIHGRGDAGEQLRDQIVRESSKTESDLHGIAEPVIMDLSGMGALSVPDVFENLASQVSAAIAIVTADDVGGFARAEGREFSAKQLRLEPRARENLWVEVGWFWGRLGRKHVFLWLKEGLTPPSDLQGAAETRAADMEKAWDSIRAFLVRLRTPEFARP